MKARIITTPIPGLLVIEAERLVDGRGWFAELWRRSELAAAGLDFRPVQENISVSRKGTLRGLHFQRGAAAQAKLVSVLAGAAWDVAVDLRPDSPTWGRWWGCELESSRGRSLFVPRGFAHGFLALADESLVHYACDAEYEPASEGGLRWDDPELAIDWPAREVILSARDADLPPLDALR